jgi:Condensation domain
MHLNEERLPSVERFPQDSGVVRPLGPLERMWHWFGQMHPQHFLLAAEFDSVLSEHEVRDALSAVQGRQPLLQVSIESSANGPVFSRTENPAPIGLRTVEVANKSDWTHVAADELTERIDSATAPLARAVLITAGDDSVLLLAFDHVICDGMSAVRVLDELISVLNGSELHPLPVPASHETLVSGRMQPVDPAVLADLPVPEERMRRWPNYLPFGSTRAKVHTHEFGRDTTDQILRACRNENTTVQGLLVAALTQARGRLRGEEFVRVDTPIDTRQLLDAETAASSLTMAVARTGHETSSQESPWDRARRTHAEIQAAAAPPAVAVGAAAVGHFITPDAGPVTAEHFMNDQLTFEMQISNLRTLKMAESGPLRPTAVWGPMLLLQIDGESNAGVATYDGVLRIVLSGHAPNADLLEEACRIITDATANTVARG